MRDSTNSARAIRIGNRFFWGFTRTGRAQITPYLAGAKLYFLDIHDRLDADCERLRRKGWDCSICSVCIEPGSAE